MTRSYRHDSPLASAAAPGPPPTYDTNVLSRLHALFAPVPSHTSAGCSPRRHSRGELSPDRTMDGPAVMQPAQSVMERESIKVKVVTWNMGDSLPKGDLSVLLGEVPTYTGGSPTGGLPILPVEDTHPYHIIVVAAQECPTDSGVPRGLGGGIMKGVSGRVGHRKEKEKEKEKEKWSHEKDGEDKAEKEPAGESVLDAVAEKVLPPTPKPFGLDGEEGDASRAASPSLSSPHTLNSGKGTKGWSTMLDEWFCGPPDKPSDGGLTTPIMQDSYSMPDNRDMPSPYPPAIARSASAPGKAIALSDPISIPSPRPVVATNGRTIASPSPLARSQSDSDSSGSSQQEASLPHFLSVPQEHSTPLHHKRSDGSLRARPDRPGVVIPTSPNPSAMGLRGSKCYVHVIKERLMGMYLSVYVYRGCEHLIQGVDKDFVTAGLAGGRVGNKGGIGISLKLADHRFLFVNSHLAAHTSRQQARLENIEKIKRELHLDTFLPKDDPRMEESDITDRFDTVFWCGDLNFRTDLSRLHAEWLVEQKKYSEMLMWDQLRNAMKDPATNPFPGFLEADIDFPPTFKYDVWRSLKHTVREQRKSLRRRNTNESRHRPALEPSSIPLDHVPEMEPQEEVIAERGEEDEELEPPRRSFESYVHSTTTSAAPSIIGTEADDDSGSDIAPVIGAGAYGSKHRALEVAMKEKTKHFLSIMKLDSVLTPKKKGRRADRVVSTDMTTEFDTGSRRTSISSLASMRHDKVNGVPLRHEEAFSPPSDAQSSADAYGTSFGSSMSAAGVPKRPSRFASLKRSVSGRSVKKGDGEYPLGEEDDMPDIREGKYDTSKKQRVPSWCDRVLWKAHIEPDPLPELQPSAPMSRDRLSRFSQAFVHFGDHFRPSFARTSSIDAAHVDRVRIDRPLPPTPPESHSHTPEPHSPSPLVESPSSTPETPFQSPHGGQGLVPGPRGTKSPFLNGRNSSPIKRHPLLGSPSDVHSPGNWSPPARPRITFERASTQDHNHVQDSFSRRRANSDSVPAVKPLQRASTTDAPPTVESPGGSDRSSSPSLASRRGAMAPIHWSAGAHTMSANSKQWRRTRTIEPSAFAPHPSTAVSPDARLEDKSSFSRFIRDLPNWLHSRNSTIVDPSVGRTDPPSPAATPVVPRRRKGEVVCLGYGTIDDVGMRQLEGRSDHRPAIFAAAVYV